MTGKEGRPVVAFAVYCGVCGYYIIAKDYRISVEHRTSINEHIKARHRDAKLNLWRAPFSIRASINEVYLEDFATEAAAKSWQVGAKKMGWKGTNELDLSNHRRS